MSEKKVEEMPGNFIHDIIDADLESGRHRKVVTRFPPEPNGFLHIGHAKAIVLNFGTAQKYGGRCHLRFDDTNPQTEDTLYVESIQEDVQWLGYDWGEHLYFASDYFEMMHECALHLIREGKAYVDSLSTEEIRAYRGTAHEPGRESPYRERSVEENLDLFARMKAGEFGDGEHVLRAKIDMSAANILMRDPLLYRIRHAHHHNRGDEWCIYPMYDFAHCLEDAFEHVTHSLCSLEFENNREIYDWVIENTPVPARPRQYEFARLSLGYTVMSKRKILRLVESGKVDGWDDPRLPTLAGLRRRGVPASAIREFCHRIGVTKANSRVEYEFFETILRDDLNVKVPRVMAVIDPLKVVITNYPEEKVEWLEAEYYPHDVPLEGSRKVPFGRELYIERDDFRMEPSKKWYRLAPGTEVRLRYGYYITCEEVITDADGEIVELRCSYDPESRGGDTPDGRKVKGTIHWVSAAEAKRCEFRLYDRLFAVENPEEDKEVDFLEHINPDSLEVKQGYIEPSVVGDDVAQRYQFERKGYFWREQKESGEGLVFNRIVSLRDSWAKLEAEKEKAKEAEERASAARKAKEEAARAQATAQRSAAPVVTERDLAREADSNLKAAYERFQEELGLNEEVADVLTGDAVTLGYFEAAVQAHPSGAAASVGAYVVNEVLPRVEDGAAVTSLGLDARAVGELVGLIDADRITGQVGREVLEKVIEKGERPEAIVEAEGLEKVSDDAVLTPVIEAVMAANPDEVGRYRAGNQRLIGFFIGQVMKSTGGTADPQKLRKLLGERLAE